MGMNQSKQVWGMSAEWKGTNQGLCKRSAGRCVQGSERLNEPQTRSLMGKSSRCRNQMHRGSSKRDATMFLKKNDSRHLHFSTDALHICVYVLLLRRLHSKLVIYSSQSIPGSINPPITWKKKGVKKQCGAPAVKLMAAEWH